MSEQVLLKVEGFATVQAIEVFGGWFSGDLLELADPGGKEAFNFDNGVHILKQCVIDLQATLCRI